jgi:cytochrome P450
LARLEARVFFAALATRFRAIEPAAEPRRNGLINLRGLATLPLTVRTVP